MHSSYLTKDSEVTETIKRKYAGQSWDSLAKFGQLSVPGEVSICLGNSVQNRDCSGKSRTDGHNAKLMMHGLKIEISS